MSVPYSKNVWRLIPQLLVLTNIHISAVRSVLPVGKVAPSSATTRAPTPSKERAQPPLGQSTVPTCSREFTTCVWQPVSNKTKSDLKQGRVDMRAHSLPPGPPAGQRAPGRGQKRACKLKVVAVHRRRSSPFGTCGREATARAGRRL